MLADLPFELLAQVILYLPRAQFVSSLALTCRRLNGFVEDEGWRIFVQTFFPSIETPKLWKDASQALTAYSRNWDRRALIARLVQPDTRILRWPGGTRQRRWSQPRGQTMGFQPAIDSYLEWTGSSWTARREVLAYSAGAELVLRVKAHGSGREHQAADLSEASSDDPVPDRYGNITHWATFRPPGSVQGLDDITGLRLRRPDLGRATQATSCESVVLGTASGSLMSLTVPFVGTEIRDVSSKIYLTNGRPVKSLDTSPGSRPLLAASLSGTHVALYPLSFPDGQSDQPPAPPVDEVTSIPPSGIGPRQQCWTVRFLSPQRLAVGIGPSGTPLSVYDIREDGITETPIRQFQCRLPDQEHNGVDFRYRTPVTASYQILPLSCFNNSDQQSGDVFLAGFHDGYVTLTDMRSPRDYVQTFRDPIDHSAIYSLAAVGRERFVAGSSRHSTVKFFDLRMSGVRARYYEEYLPEPDRKPSRQGGAKQERKGGPMHGWNLFLNSREDANTMRQPWRSMRGGRGRGSGRTNTQLQTRDSPIYSLSTPSPCSPSLFAGIENKIVQIDLVAMMDPHPDPIFREDIFGRLGTSDADVKETWDPVGDVMNLAMYEHLDERDIGMMNQASAGNTLKRDLWVDGYDERWRKGEKWKKDRSI